MLRATLTFISLTALLSACAAPVMNPGGDVHERVVFDSPTRTVMFVYQSLAAGRYGEMSEAFLNYADRRIWIGYDQRGESHPWTDDRTAVANVTGFHQQPNGEVLLVVTELWGEEGYAERRFLVLFTADGWKIGSVNGAPGDGLLAP